MRYTDTRTIIQEIPRCDVNGSLFARQDSQFFTSDSRTYKVRTFLGGNLPAGQGPMTRIRKRVDRAGEVCQALDLLKVDGAGYTENLSGTDNEAGSAPEAISGLPEVYVRY